MHGLEAFEFSQWFYNGKSTLTGCEQLSVSHALYLTGCVEEVLSEWRGKKAAEIQIKAPYSSATITLDKIIGTPHYTGFQDGASNMRPGFRLEGEQDAEAQQAYSHGYQQGILLRSVVHEGTQRILGMLRSSFEDTALLLDRESGPTPLQGAETPQKKS